MRASAASAGRSLSHHSQLGRSASTVHHVGRRVRCRTANFGQNRVVRVQRLDVDGVSLAYSVQGRGAGLLVPLCNFDWSGTSAVQALAEHFTVVVAAPRGYSSSTWLADGAYDTATACEDLLAVCRAVGLERTSLIGYSLTAALALRLAAHSDRVDAVVA